MLPRFLHFRNVYASELNMEQDWTSISLQFPRCSRVLQRTSEWTEWGVKVLGFWKKGMNVHY